VNRFTGFVGGFVLALVVTGCGAKEAAQPAGQVPVVSKGLPAMEPEVPVRPKVLALGDSITAGFGVFQTEAYPALLQAELETDGYAWEVVNAGESGDTSATALRRIDWLLDPNVKIAIVAVGGNDALRGIPPSTTKQNVSAIIEKIRAKGVEVLLCGMKAPPNLGPDYASAFEALFGTLSRQYDTKFLPFLLADVAGDPELNQADGIHPTAAGQKIIAAHIIDLLKPMVDDIANRQGGGH
jgi:acyl-CoA thioesterase-1